MQQTYELEKGPSATSWTEYSLSVSSAWKALLNTAEGQSERNIQSFLEKHPCLVPGGQSMSGPSGHCAYPAALVTQPRLPGFGGRIPDFLWIAADSLTTYVVLIEIEAPGKRWFTKAGNPSAALTQAQHQLAEWKEWFSFPLNQDHFRNAYCRSFGFPWRRLLPQFVLIYGRREEFDGQERLSGKRAFLPRSDEYYMTYDRLHPIKDHDQYMTAKFDGTNYKAVSIPPTLELGPALAHYRSVILDKEHVVDQMQFVSEERREFLKRRLPYWDEWCRSGGGGIKHLGDKE